LRIDPPCLKKENVIFEKIDANNEEIVENNIVAT